MLNKCIENSMENMHTLIIGCEGSKGMQKLVIKNVSKSLMCKASMESGFKVSIPMSMDERNHFSHVWGLIIPVLVCLALEGYHQ